MYTTKYTTTSNCNSSLRGGVDINPYQVVTRSLTHADLLSEFDIRRGLVLALGSIQYTTLTVYSHVVLIINPRTLITHKAHFLWVRQNKMGLSLWHAVYRLVFLNLLWQVVHATSFLSDTLLRKGQIQDVLEHHPAKHTECRNSKVHPPLVTKLVLIPCSQQVR